MYELHIVTTWIDRYELHQFIWKLLGQQDDSNREQRGFLFSADDIGNGQILLTVRSSRKRNGNLPWIRKDTPTAKGAAVDFSLQSCPTMRRSSKEIALHGHDAERWLETQGNNNGFRVDDLWHRVTSPLMFQKPGCSRVITLNAGSFAGRLVVTDEALFSRAMTGGIGRHKGFGFGLLKLSA